MQKLVRTLGFAAAAAFCAAGVFAAEPIPIVALYNVSGGGLASLDVPSLNGVKLKAKMINDGGGLLDGRMIEVQAIDTRNDTSEAATAAKRVVVIENLAAGIGQSDTTFALAIAPLFPASGPPGTARDNDRGPMLLQSGDADPVVVETPNGSSPLVFVSDHAGRAPGALGDLGLDEAERSRHIGWDIGICGVTTELARGLDAVYVLHAEANGRPCVEIEVRQDLIGKASGQRDWARLLADILPRAVAASGALDGPSPGHEGPRC